MTEIKRITIADNEEYLRQISEEVDFNDKSYLEDIKKLEEFCKHNEVFAMAAVQIGIPKRIIYLKNTTTDLNKNNEEGYNEAKVLINPKILSRKGHTRYLEGCASCLDYCGVVERPYQVEMEYYTPAGNKKIETFTSFPATVVSHENDHLDGIFHMDIALEVLRLTPEERTIYRQNHPYEIIDKEKEYLSIENKNQFKKTK